MPVGWFRHHRFVSGNPDGLVGVSTSVDDRSRAEQDLLVRARRGDVHAYEDLVRLHQPTVFRAAYVLTRSVPEAEEATQDAFVKAWAALHRFRLGAPFRPWVLAIVANEARTRVRANGRRRDWTTRAARDERWSPEGTSPSAEAVALEQGRSRQLREALDRLGERDRTVIELRFLLDLSEREAAAALGCRPGTVKSRLSRALSRLRDELGERP